MERKYGAKADTVVLVWACGQSAGGGMQLTWPEAVPGMRAAGVIERRAALVACGDLRGGGDADCDESEERGELVSEAAKRSA